MSATADEITRHELEARADWIRAELNTLEAKLDGAQRAVNVLAESVAVKNAELNDGPPWFFL